MFSILNELYQTREIEMVSQEPHKADFVMYLDEEKTQKIIIENKNLNTNIPKVDLLKLYKDVETNNCYAILFSQHSGITNKTNFLVETHDSNYILYVSNVEYNPQSIKLANRLYIINTI